MTRRRFLTAAALTAAVAPIQSCSSSDAAYDDAVETTWRPFDGRITGRRALQHELVRYATLAPSSHNTQCWKFRLEDHRISIFPDLARRCAIVDSDDHHLFVSLGCATENLVQAALARGLRSDVRFDPAAGGTVRVVLEPAKTVMSPLFGAIPIRQCTRAEYDGRSLQTAQLRLLEAAGEGNGVRIILLTRKSQMEQVTEYVIRGNTVQMNDPAFMDELRSWIRFSDAEAVARRDGLFSRASGNPSVPRWLGSPMLKLFFTPKSENDKYARFIRSSAGIAVFVSDTSDKRHWVEAGRCYERFALQAAAMGVRTAMVNQPVEVSRLRADFAKSLGVGGRRPDLVVRFGYGPEMPRSLRRRVDAVIV